MFTQLWWQPPLCIWHSSTSGRGHKVEGSQSAPTQAAHPLCAAPGSQPRPLPEESAPGLGAGTQTPGALLGTSRTLCSMRKPCPPWGDPQVLPARRGYLGEEGQLRTAQGTPAVLVGSRPLYRKARQDRVT